jgi:hypothetical protein
MVKVRADSQGLVIQRKSELDRFRPLAPKVSLQEKLEKEPIGSGSSSSSLSSGLEWALEVSAETYYSCGE